MCTQFQTWWRIVTFWQHCLATVAFFLRQAQVEKISKNFACGASEIVTKCHWFHVKNSPIDMWPQVSEVSVFGSKWSKKPFQVYLLKWRCLWPQAQHRAKNVQLLFRLGQRMKKIQKIENRGTHFHGFVGIQQKRGLKKWKSSLHQNLVGVGAVGVDYVTDLL